MSEITNLYRTFQASEYGQELESRTRFDVFKPDFVGTAMWTRLLGQDVNNLYHMTHTVGIANEFSQYNGLDRESRGKLLRTAVTHDWGEAIIGDIPLPDKTDADESREEVAYRHIATDLLGQHGEELSDEVWEVLSHHDKDHGDMFRAIEYVGYCTTAIRAGKVATALAHGFVRLDVSRPQKEQLMGGLLGLEKAVTVHNFPTLTAYIDKYPGIERQLWRYRDDI